MVLSLDSSTPPAWYSSTNAIPGWGENKNRLYKTDKIVMRKIPAANVRWRMGSPHNEPSRTAEREIPHWVTLTQDYYMGIYPCTRLQYERITGYAGTTTFKDYEDYNFRPVGKIPYSIVRGSVSKNIDWPATGSDVASGSAIYNIRDKALLDTIDLPTEAQWEYACRAGEGAGLYNGEERLRLTTFPGMAARRRTACVTARCRRLRSGSSSPMHMAFTTCWAMCTNGVSTGTARGPNIPTVHRSLIPRERKPTLRKVVSAEAVPTEWLRRSAVHPPVLRPLMKTPGMMYMVSGSAVRQLQNEIGVCDEECLFNVCNVCGRSGVCSASDI